MKNTRRVTLTMMLAPWLILSCAITACFKQTELAAGYIPLTPSSLGTGPGRPENLAGLSQIHVSPDGQLIYVDHPIIRSSIGESGRGLLLTRSCLTAGTGLCRMNVVEALQRLKFAGWGKSSAKLYLIEGATLTGLNIDPSGAAPFIAVEGARVLDRELAFTFHGETPLQDATTEEIAEDLSEQWRRIKSAQASGETIWEAALSPSGTLVSVAENDLSLSLVFPNGARSQSGTPWLDNGHLAFFGGEQAFSADGVFLVQEGSLLTPVDVPWASRTVTAANTGAVIATHNSENIWNFRSGSDLEVVSYRAEYSVIIDAQSTESSFITIQNYLDGTNALCSHEGQSSSCIYSGAPSDPGRKTGLVKEIKRSDGSPLYIRTLLAGEAPSSKAIIYYHGGPSGSSAYLPTGQLRKILVRSGWDLVIVEYSGSSTYDLTRSLSFSQDPLGELAKDAPFINQFISDEGYSSVAVVGFSFGALPAIFADEVGSNHCTILLMPYLKYRDPSIWNSRNELYQRFVDAQTLGRSPAGIEDFSLRLASLVDGWRPNGPTMAVFGNSDLVSRPEDIGNVSNVRSVVVPGDHTFAVTHPMVDSEIEQFLSHC